MAINIQNVMAKLNIIPAIVLYTFTDSISEPLMNKLCNDTKSLLGRVEKDMKSKDGKWTCSSKGVLSSKEGHKVQLPLNNPLTTLIQFGMQINAIADNMGLLKLEKDELSVSEHGITSEIPSTVREWVKQQELELKEAKRSSDKTDEALGMVGLPPIEKIKA